MERGPCVVYGRRILEDGFPSFLYEEILEEWRRRNCTRKEKKCKRVCEGYGTWCVFLLLLFIFFLLCLTFPLEYRGSL